MNFLFDVDGTLTPSRQRMNYSFKLRFIEWIKKQQDSGNKVFFVTGSDKDKTVAQVGKDLWVLVDGSYQNCGNQLYKNGSLVKQSQWKMSSSLYSDICSLLKNSIWHGRAGKNIEERVGMVNISTVGREASIQLRKEYFEWDNKKGERQRIVSSLSSKYPELGFAVGGEISIDVYPKGKDKSQVLDDMIGESVFLGDRCEEGGNDFSIAEKSNKKYHIEDWKEMDSLLGKLEGLGNPNLYSYDFQNSFVEWDNGRMAYFFWGEDAAAMPIGSFSTREEAVLKREEYCDWFYSHKSPRGDWDTNEE